MVSESVSENIVIHPFDERARLLAFVLNHLRGDYVHFVQPDAERMRSVRRTCVSPTEALPWRNLMLRVPGFVCPLRCSEKLPSIGLISPIVPWIRLPVETSRWYAASLNCNVMFIMLC